MSSMMDDENGSSSSSINLKTEIETDAENELDDNDLESTYDSIESPPLEERCLGDDGDDVDVNCNRCQKTFTSFKLFAKHLHTRNLVPGHTKENRKNSTVSKSNPLLKVEVTFSDDETDNRISPTPVSIRENVQEEEEYQFENNSLPICPPISNIDSSSSSISTKRKPKYYTILKSSPSCYDSMRMYSSPIKKRKKKITKKLKPSSTTIKSSPIKTIEREDGRTLFVCSVQKCGKTFSYKKVYNNHMKNHKIQIQENEQKEQREATQEVMKLKESPKEKSPRKSRPTPPPPPPKKQRIQDFPLPANYHCPIDKDCDATFKTQLDLRLHRAEHRKKDREEKRKQQEKTPQEWPCQVEGCGETFPNSAERYTHTWRIHLIFDKFDCTQCDRSFRTEETLRNHEKTHNSDKGGVNKVFSCQICKIFFTSSYTLANHNNRQHGYAERTFKCTDCDKSFFKSNDLTIHRRVHSKEKPYSCSQCDKRFTCLSNYRKHVQTIHLGLKQYLCPECGQSFSRSGGLSRHRKAVHAKINSKKALCTLCGKLFQDKSALVRHQSVHNGQKHFKCPDPLCTSAYTQPPGLKRHIQKSHSEISTQEVNELIKTLINASNDSFNNHSDVLPDNSQYDMVL